MNALTKEETIKLKNYKGQLVHNFRHDVKKDENGIVLLDENGLCILNSPDPIIEIKDSRKLELEKLKYIREIWNELNETVLNLYPYHVQHNAALGLLTDNEKTEITNFIKAVKTEFASRKSAILNANTCDEVVQIAKAAYPDNIKVIQNTL
jgi:hypothetical protein